MKSMAIVKVSPIEENPLSFLDMEPPSPGERDLKVMVEACGVCHTDLHIAEGEVKPPFLPLIPGHQIVGIVVETGKSVKKFKKGQRVGIGWLNSTCGDCEFCRKGMENLCEKAKFTGYSVNGGYGEYAVVNEDFAFPMPDDIDPPHLAPLLCGGVIGYRAYKLCEVKEGTIGIFGFGSSAHIIIQVIKSEGLKAFVFTRSREHRKLAEDMGADWTGNYGEEPPGLVDSGIIFAPSGDVVPLALKYLKPGGTMVINAIYMTDIPSLKYEYIYRERKIKTVTNYTRKDGEEFLQMAGKLRVQTKIETFNLKEANAVLRNLKYGKINGSAVLVRD